MNKVLMSLVFSGLLLTGTSFAQNPPPADAPAAPAAPVVKPHHEHGEHHPEIHKAMRKLKGAKQDLIKAAHDYGGHKAKAMADIDQALDELKEALAADKK